MRNECERLCGVIVTDDEKSHLAVSFFFYYLNPERVIVLLVEFNERKCMYGPGLD